MLIVLIRLYLNIFYLDIDMSSYYMFHFNGDDEGYCSADSSYSDHNTSMSLDKRQCHAEANKIIDTCEDYSGTAVVEFGQLSYATQDDIKNSFTTIGSHMEREALQATDPDMQACITGNIPED